jgi:hypothetical protein
VIERLLFGMTGWAVLAITAAILAIALLAGSR